MNILWIEDKAEDEYINLKERLFFGKNGLINKEIDHLDIPENFTEADKCIANGANDEYDYAILDINLVDWADIPGYINTEDAGFYFFSELVFSGFPSNRILFLTENVTKDEIDNIRAFHIMEKYIDNIQRKITTFEDGHFEKICTISNPDNKFQLGNNIEEGKYNEAYALLKEFTPKLQNKNTFDALVDLCRLTYIDIPECMTKQENDFHIWLNSHLHRQDDESKNGNIFKYLTLRRGIIEACTYWLNKFEGKNPKSTDDIIFNNGLKDRSSDYEQKLSIDDIKDMLKRWKIFFPCIIPNNTKDFYYRFLKDLSFIWDKSKGYFSYSKEDDFHKRQRLKDIYNRQSNWQSIMKNIRNWSAHDKLSKDDLTEEFLAYVFMIAIRSLISTDLNTVEIYEKIFFQLFKKPEHCINSCIENGLNNKIPSSHQELFRELNKYKQAESFTFKDIAAKVYKGNTDSKNKTNKRLYQMLWHFEYPVKTEYKINNSKSTIELSFAKGGRITWPDERAEFIESLGQHIYLNTFS